MEITEVRIKLIDEAGDRLQGFCSITFDNSFVVRDLKIIDGAQGPFVAMPSRKLACRCPQCGCKNHLRASYCNQCGLRLSENRLPRDDAGRAKLYADIAHPINAACREMIQSRVVSEFQAELERAKSPDYVSRYDDYDLEEEFAESADLAGDAGRNGSRPPERARTHRKVEPPQTPQGPHRPQSHVAGNKPDSRGGEFGAGVF